MFQMLNTQSLTKKHSEGGGSRTYATGKASIILAHDKQHMSQVTLK
jgi:hypothetical protein